MRSRVAAEGSELLRRCAEAEERAERAEVARAEAELERQMLGDRLAQASQRMLTPHRSLTPRRAMPLLCDAVPCSQAEVAMKGTTMLAESEGVAAAAARAEAPTAASVTPFSSRPPLHALLFAGVDRRGGDRCAGGGER